MAQWCFERIHHWPLSGNGVAASALKRNINYAMPPPLHPLFEFDQARFNPSTDPKEHPAVRGESARRGNPGAALLPEVTVAAPAVVSIETPSMIHSSTFVPDASTTTTVHAARTSGNREPSTPSGTTVRDGLAMELAKQQ